MYSRVVEWWAKGSTSSNVGMLSPAINQLNGKSTIVIMDFYVDLSTLQ